jgi:hypothetical protein
LNLNWWVDWVVGGEFEFGGFEFEFGELVGG